MVFTIILELIQVNLELSRKLFIFLDIFGELSLSQKL